MSEKKLAMLVEKSGSGLTGEISLSSSASVVNLDAEVGVKYLIKGENGLAPENATFARVGDDLHLILAGETEPVLVVDGYYQLAESPKFFGQAEDGSIYEYGRTDGGGIFSLADGEISAVALVGESVVSDDGDLSGALFLPVLLGGGILGIGIAAVNTSLDKKDKSQPTPQVLPQLPEVDDPPNVEDVPSGNVPSVPQILSVQSDVGDGRLLQQGGVGNDATPTIVGTADSGNTVHVYDNGVEIGTATVDDGGRWVFTPSPALEEGQHTITARAIDSTGKTSAYMNGWNFEVDIQAPSAPTIGLVTEDPAPTLSGTAEAGSTIDIYVDDNVLLGVVFADVDGQWSYTQPSPLDDGEHRFTATATDPAGNISVVSDAVTLTINNAAADANNQAMTSVTNEHLYGTGADDVAYDGGTLVLDGHDMHIDLGALGTKAQGIEKFDLGHAVNNRTLNHQDVNDAWMSSGTKTVDGVNYNVYTTVAHTCELLVEDKVNVTIL